MSRAGRASGQVQPGLEPEGGGGDLHGAGVEVDAVQVVGQDALHDGPVGPALLIRLAAMAGLLQVEGEEQLERDHQEVAGADGGVEDLEVAHRVRGLVDGVRGDGLGDIVGPAVLGLAVERHQVGEGDLAPLPLAAPVGAALVQGAQQAP